MRVRVRVRVGVQVHQRLSLDEVLSQVYFAASSEILIRDSGGVEPTQSRVRVLFEVEFVFGNY